MSKFELPSGRKKSDIPTFEDITGPLRVLFNDILNQAYPARGKRRKVKGLRWTGINKLDSSIGATTPPPSEQLSDEGLAYNAERDRDIFDMFIMVAVQQGINQGIAIQKVETENWKSIAGLGSLIRAAKNNEIELLDGRPPVQETKDGKE